MVTSMLKLARELATLRQFVKAVASAGCEANRSEQKDSTCFGCDALAIVKRFGLEKKR